jgi:hypothetical protein
MKLDKANINWDGKIWMSGKGKYYLTRNHHTKRCHWTAAQNEAHKNNNLGRIIQTASQCCKASSLTMIVASLKQNQIQY